MFAERAFETVDLQLSALVQRVECLFIAFKAEQGNAAQKSCITGCLFFQFLESFLRTFHPEEKSRSGEFRFRRAQAFARFGNEFFQLRFLRIKKFPCGEQTECLQFFFAFPRGLEEILRVF